MFNPVNTRSSRALDYFVKPYYFSFASFQLDCSFLVVHASIESLTSNKNANEIHPWDLAVIRRYVAMVTDLITLKHTPRPPQTHIRNVNV